MLRSPGLPVRFLRQQLGLILTIWAVLGLNSQIGAQRLARLLLADPLGQEEEWEKELDSAGEEAVLLRYVGIHALLCRTRAFC